MNSVLKPGSQPVFEASQNCTHPLSMRLSEAVVDLLNCECQGGSDAGLPAGVRAGPPAHLVCGPV